MNTMNASTVPEILQELRSAIYEHNMLIPTMDRCDVMTDNLEDLYDSIVSSGHSLTLYNGFLDDGGAGIVEIELDGETYDVFDEDPLED